MDDGMFSYRNVMLPRGVGCVLP